MTQPLDILYVEVVARTDKFEKDLDKKTDRAYDKVDKRSKATSAVIVSDFRLAAERARQAVIEPFNRMFGDLQVGFSAVKRSGDDALRGVKSSSDDADQALGRLAKAIGRNTGLLGNLFVAGSTSAPVLIGLLATLAGSLAVVARVAQNVISILQFGLAGLPGLIVGVASSFLILRAAFSGIGAAFTELTEQQDAAGASGVSNARAVADAQRGVLQAQKDLIKAKEDEIDRIRTLAIEIQRARATEARAADDVLKAEYALQRARDVGTPRSQIEAQLALDEARASLVEAKADTKNLAAEKAKADKVGVNGSEQVLRAQEALLDAQDRLAQSQVTVSAGIGRQTKAFDGLTKSAQAFVLALVEAQRRLEPVQDAIQEAFFAGTAPLIEPIVDSLIDLQPELVAVAAGFGDIFKEILTFLGTPEAKEALRSVLVGVADFLREIKPSIGPLLKAFTGLVGDSGKFGTILGGKVATALNKIANFVSTVDIDQLFLDAKDAVKELSPLISNLAKIAVSLFNIFAFAGKYILPIFVGQLNLVAGVFGFVDQYITDFKKNFNSAVEDVKNGSLRITAFISAIPAKLTALGKSFLASGKALISKLFEGINSAGGFATDFAKNLANTFVRFFNNTVIRSINTGIKAIQDGFNKIPGLSISLPKLANIPALEKGGLLTEDGIFRGGEKGRKEAVLPLEDSRVMALIGNAIASAGGLGNGGGIVFAPGSIVIQFSGSTPPTDVRARQIGTAIATSAASSLERRNIRSRIRIM